MVFVVIELPEIAKKVKGITHQSLKVMFQIYPSANLYESLSFCGFDQVTSDMLDKTLRRTP